MEFDPKEFLKVKELVETQFSESKDIQIKDLQTHVLKNGRAQQWSNRKFRLSPIDKFHDDISWKEKEVLETTEPSNKSGKHHQILDSDNRVIFEHSWKDVYYQRFILYNSKSNTNVGLFYDKDDLLIKLEFAQNIDNLLRWYGNYGVDNNVVHYYDYLASNEVDRVLIANYNLDELIERKFQYNSSSELESAKSQVKNISDFF